RNDFPDIESFNKDAGEIAEAYRVLAIADFPDRFDTEMIGDLISIIQNGPRCGIFTVMHVDQSKKLPEGFSTDALAPFCLELTQRDGTRIFEVQQTSQSKDSGLGALVELDTPPEPEAVNAIVTKFGEQALSAAEVAVPYEHLEHMIHGGKPV